MRRFICWVFALVVVVSVSGVAQSFTRSGGKALAAVVGAMPNVKLTVTAGFDGRVSPDRWAPVVVEANNQGAAATGRLVVRQQRGAGGGVAEYSVPLSLAEGTRKRLTLAVPAQTGANVVEARFVTDQGELAWATAALRVGGPDDLLIGVLSREPESLGALAAVKLSGRTGNVRVANLTADSMPDSLALMNNFHVFVIARFDTERLSSAQTGALEAWVRRGGLLVLLGGADWSGTLSNLPPDLVPVRPAGNRSIESLPVFEALGNNKELPARGQPFALTTSTLRNARALALDGTDPVIAVGQHGQGKVMFFGVDLTREPFVNWSGAAAMWETVLMPHLSGGFWSSGTRSPGNPALMAKALASQPVLKAPDVKRLTLWLGGYLLLISPITFGLCALARRRGAAWFAVPLLAAAALGLFYYQGFVRDSGAVTSRTVSVTEVIRDMPKVSSRTYAALYAPSEPILRVNLGAGDLAAPLSLNAGEAAPAELTRIILDEQPRAEVEGLTNWSLRGLMIDREVPGLSGLVIDLGLRGPRLTGTITNGTGKTVRDALLITPLGALPLPDLAPGAAVPVDAPLLGVRREWQPVFQDVFSGGDAKDGRVQLFKRQVAEAAVGTTHEALPSSILFVGWLDEPHAPMDSMGRQTTGTHLVYAPVQPRVDPLQYDLPHGVLLGQLVASEGLQRSRSPEGYFVQEGALTFSLRLPDVDRSVMQDVNLRVETGGQKGDVKVKLLNWTTGKWDDFDRTAPGKDLTLWDRFVAPDGGMLIRVEVPKDSLFVRSPTISLKGGL